MKVLELECKVEMKPYGISAGFSGGFGNKIIEITTEEEYKKLKELVSDITGIIGEAIAREVKELENKAMEEVENMKLSPEFEELLDEAEKKFEELKTDEERMKYTLEIIGKAMGVKMK